MLHANGAEAAIDAAEKSWASAITHNDFATLEKVLAEELIYTHSSGRTDTKREYIDSMKTGRVKYESLTYESSSVKVLGQTALLSAKATVKLVSGGKPQELKLSFLHVYMNQKGSWRMVGHQSARLQ